MCAPAPLPAELDAHCAPPPPHSSIAKSTNWGCQDETLPSLIRLGRVRPDTDYGVFWAGRPTTHHVLQGIRTCTPCVPGVRGARLMRPLQTKRLHADIRINEGNAKMKIVYSKYHMFRKARDYFCGTALRPPSRHEAQLRIINARGAFGAEKRTCSLHCEQCVCCCCCCCFLPSH